MEGTSRQADGGRRCRWDAVRAKRAKVPGPTRAAGRHLPHDLSTFVVEAELGLASGFWGCVARSATFRSLPRRRTEEGRKVIRDHVADLDAAEVLVRWRSLPPDGAIVLEWRG